MEDDKFEEVVRPVIKYLNEIGNPYLSLIITTDSAELKSGERYYHTDEFLPD